MIDIEYNLVYDVEKCNQIINKNNIIFIINGNYKNLRNFIYNIENMEVLTVISQIKIENERMLRTDRRPKNMRDTSIDLLNRDLRTSSRSSSDVL